MARLKTSFRNFFKITLPTFLVLFILLEVFFRVAIPASERPDPVFDHALQLAHYNPGTEGLYTIGNAAQQRGRWRINNHGWNSTVDYGPKGNRPRLMLIGDSFVEAFQVDVDSALPALLRTSLAEELEVYSMGRAGAPLSHYLHFARVAKQQYAPDVLVINVVGNDFDQSLAVNGHPGYFLTLTNQDGQIREVPPLPYPEIGWRKWIKYSALIRYIHYNLRLSTVLGRMDGGAVQTNSAYWLEAADDMFLERLKASVHYTVQALRETYPDTRILFVMDADRLALYAGTLAESKQNYLGELLAEAARANGCEFLDLRPVFETRYARDQRSFNTVYDSHWDAYGHRVVAEAILSKLADAPTD